jgi:LysR family glycine cleavage system transcriptional activator
MNNNNNNNISFSAIRTFTVVATELSFTRAAELLHISPSAVSHQMKLLENQLGVILFHRKSKGVCLSLAGEALQKHACSGVKDIQHGISQSQFASQKEKLVIAIIPSLCQHWLMPRLAQFCDKYPHIELEIIAADQLVDFSKTQYDCHIHFGSGEYKGLEKQFLANETIYPVCHPDLLMSIQDTSLAALLNNHKLLHYKAGIEDEPGGITWGDWLRTFSIEKPVSHNQIWYSHVAIALTGAKLKQGIALGWHHMVKDDIASGQLHRITSASLSTHYSYYLVAPNKSWKSDTFTLFHHWLQQQMRT